MWWFAQPLFSKDVVCLILKPQSLCVGLDVCGVLLQFSPGALFFSVCPKTDYSKLPLVN